MSNENYPEVKKHWDAICQLMRDNSWDTLTLPKEAFEIRISVHGLINPSVGNFHPSSNPGKLL